jgi:hypothetical protein
MSSARSRCFALIVVGALLALGASSPAVAATGIGWLSVPGSGATSITDIDASSATDMWVVGVLGGGGFAQHWNGATWDAPAPAPGTLYGVTEISPTNLWAVGYQYSVSAQDDQTLIEHGNGTTWKVVKSPNPATNHNLEAVSGSSASNVWAVGQDFDPAARGGQGSYESLALHYDGTSWNAVADATAGLTYAELTSVSTISASDAWAVGRASTGPGDNLEPFAEHWDGTAWTAVPLPATLTAVSQVKQFAPGDVWILGTDASGRILEHWQGSGWTPVQTAATGMARTDLARIGGSSSSDLYVVGDVSDPDGDSFNLIEHWDGTSWELQQAPNPDDGNVLSSLDEVVSPAAGVAFAAGASNGPTVLRLGTGDFTSSMFLTAPAGGTAGHAIPLSGRLQLSEDAGTWNTMLHLDRQNPNGTHTALPDVPMDGRGFYDVTETPPFRGTYIYTISYGGTGSWPAAQAQATVNVTGTATTLTLHPSAALINHHTAVTVTAHLSAHGTNGTVSIYEQGVGGSRALVRTAAVDADGNMKATVTLDITNTFDAVYNGDPLYNPATSAKIKVAVRVAITGAQSGYYGTSAGYRLFHYRTTCGSNGIGCPTYNVAVSPSHTGEKVAFTLQQLTASGWRTAGTASSTLGPLSKTKILLLYNTRSIIGLKFRWHATFAGDARNASNTTGWAYFRITS